MHRRGENPVLTVPVSEQRDHILGATKAAVTLVEYGDFECPHCGRAYFALKDLLKLAPNQVRLVYRHFPLTQIHPHSQRAAEAAEVAANQGKFWQMHSALYEHQDRLDEYDLVRYAHELELDQSRFRSELLQGGKTARVREDFISGVRSGVNGTPTFYLNGRRYDDSWDLESLMTAIEAEAAELRCSFKGIP